MLIIPSLYIRDQKTVQLATGGLPFDSNPVEMAKQLRGVGAESIYLVDMNVPPSGNIPNLLLIQKIIETTGLEVLLAGNIRSVDVIEGYSKAGVGRVVIGILAYQKPDFLKEACLNFPKKVAAHIEVREGKVVIPGWTVAAKKTALDYANQFKDAGVTTILYSDIMTEGKLTIEDVKRVGLFINKVPMSVIHTTDFANISELELLMKLETPKLSGTILGKSMYAGAIDIASAITHVKEMVISGMDEPTLIP